jgi:DNA polymerase III subunit chi
LTSIDFYFNADDRLQVACRLAGKAYAQKKKLLIFAPAAETARRIDTMLWTWQQLSFIPHCMTRDPLAPQTPVLITSDAQDPPESDVLLNLGSECPPFFGRYERLLEIVGQDEAERSLGRARFKYYKERGYPIGTHDLAARE